MTNLSQYGSKRLNSKGSYFSKSMIPQDRLHLSLKLVLNLTLVSSADVLELTLRAYARGPSLNSANTVVEVSGAASQSISIEVGPGLT